MLALLPKNQCTFLPAESVFFFNQGHLRNAVEETKASAAAGFGEASEIEAPRT
jgi:hypothetical protein